VAIAFNTYTDPFHREITEDAEKGRNSSPAYQAVSGPIAGAYLSTSAVIVLDVHAEEHLLCIGC